MYEQFGKWQCALVVSERHDIVSAANCFHQCVLNTIYGQQAALFSRTGKNHMSSRDILTKRSCSTEQGSPSGRRDALVFHHKTRNSRPTALTMHYAQLTRRAEASIMACIVPTNRAHKLTTLT